MEIISQESTTEGLLRDSTGAGIVLGENLKFALDAVEREDHPFHRNHVDEIIEELSQGLERLTSKDSTGEASLKKAVDRLVSSLSANPTETEFYDSAIHVFSSLITIEPEYSLLAARVLSRKITNEVRSQGIRTVGQAIEQGIALDLIAPKTRTTAVGIQVDNTRDHLFEYFGLKTVYDRYLLRHPETRKVIETPQFLFARVAAGLSRSVQEAQRAYEVISRFEYMFSTPTLFNSGTKTPQLSSCFLIDSPQDSLRSIYARYTEIADLSKFSGGIGVAYHRVRSRGSLIKGTNGKSNGIIPWLKTLDSSVAAVNQGGKRKGACCVYLETWHADIEDFLELRDNTGDEARRTHNLNFSHWIPDLFMERVQTGEMWSLFDPKVVPSFPDLFGDDFRKAYVEAEAKKLYVRQVSARDLYGRMMRTLAETGNGWMNFKDSSNLKCNQTLEAGNVVHLSNLCTEILEVTSEQETAVCNLGSLNLSKFVENGSFNYDRLREVVQTIVPYMDRVIDLNYYATDKAGGSNNRWRPIGLGAMGLQDALFLLKMPFDSPEAIEVSTKIQEHIYFAALTASCLLAKEEGEFPAYSSTRTSKGVLQFDLWGVKPSTDLAWENLRKDILEHGLRNSLLVAIAPTATIASIIGCYESIEPQVSNLFKRETMSGEFLQINRYLVQDLQKLGIWDDEMINELKKSEGSVQQIDRIPQELKNIYRTAWELSMKNLIDMAAGRGAYIDQSQSLNLFMESPNVGKLSSMYHYAWKSGLKTTYYLRSRPATKIAKATVSNTAASAPKVNVAAADAVACSLENPESCESCQ